MVSENKVPKKKLTIQKDAERKQQQAQLQQQASKRSREITAPQQSTFSFGAQNVKRQKPE